MAPALISAARREMRESSMNFPLHCACAKRNSRTRGARASMHLTLYVTGYMTRAPAKCNRQARDFRGESCRSEIDGRSDNS
jgi:hypothetical protein